MNQSIKASLDDAASIMRDTTDLPRLSCRTARDVLLAVRSSKAFVQKTVHSFHAVELDGEGLDASRGLLAELAANAGMVAPHMS